MDFDKYLTERTEKRLPIVVEVRLSAQASQTGDVKEKTKAFVSVPRIVGNQEIKER